MPSSHGVIRSFLVLTLTGSIVGLTACSDQPHETEAVPAANTVATTAPAASAARPADPNGTPELTFDSLEHDFGLISDTRTYTTSFPFKNTGSGKLIISDVKAGCGCTTIGLNKYEFNPGEGDEIQIRFDPKRKKDELTKTITITANIPGETVKLAIKANVKPFLSFPETFIRFGTVLLGQEHSKIIDVYYSDPDLVFKSLIPNTRALRAEVIESGVTVAEGNGSVSYRGKIKLTIPADAPWGTLFAARVSINAYGREQLDEAPRDHTVELMVTGLVFGDIRSNYMDSRGMRVESGVASFGKLTQRSEYERVLTLTRISGAPFSVLDARLEAGPHGMKVRVEQVSPSQYKIFAYGNTGTNMGSVRGLVKVRTDVAGEEELTLRFTGLVQ